MRVLCVDDSKTMRRIIGGGAQMLGYDYLEAPNGVEALELLKDHHGDIALITLDWNMPEMDGITLLRRLKEDKRYADIPVMMITALSDRECVAEALKAGAKHYLTKPFSHEDLTSRMMETMGMGAEF